MIGYTYRPLRNRDARAASRGGNFPVSPSRWGRKSRTQVTSELEPLHDRMADFTARHARAKYRSWRRASVSFRDAKLSSDVKYRRMIFSARNDARNDKSPV